MISSAILVRNAASALLRQSEQLGDWPDVVVDAWTLPWKAGTKIVEQGSAAFTSATDSVVDAYNKGLLAVQDAALLPGRVVQQTLTESAQTFTDAGRYLIETGSKTAGDGLLYMAGRAQQAALAVATGVGDAFELFTGARPGTWAVGGVLLALVVGAALIWLVLQPGGQLLLTTAAQGLGPVAAARFLL